MKTLWLFAGEPPCEQPQSQDRREEDTSQAAQQVLRCCNAHQTVKLAIWGFHLPGSPLSGLRLWPRCISSHRKR